MPIPLDAYQLEAVRKLKNGSILCASVGSGKSRTALAYYYTQYGGVCGAENYVKMVDPPDLYIITTAKKRDSYEWDKELITFRIPNQFDENPLYSNKVIIDSWNNVAKYADVTNSFFIFDEQRVVGKGKWVKSFLKIVKSNKWILLTATPGDTWSDYIPVFIANGFYRNRTEFNNEHVIFKRFTKWPEVDRYVSQGILLKHRNDILVKMDYEKQTVSHHEDISVSFDVTYYKEIIRSRWNPWDDKPIENAGEFCYALRKIVNTSSSRQIALLEVLEDHPKAIIFYNFDYELEILKDLCSKSGFTVKEWNGHKHEELPDSEKWVYLVQYTAGAEGWNCITTDTIIFYSQNYSYKTMVQAAGRIDRRNTPFTDLWYFHLRSKAGIDLAITRALKNKKKFNEYGFYNSY